MSFCEFLLHPLLGNKCKNNCSLSQLIHCVSKNAPTLASCSFNKQGLILIFFGKQYQHLSIVMCLFDFYCSFTFTYFICFLISATEMTRCWSHSVFVNNGVQQGQFWLKVCMNWKHIQLVSLWWSFPTKDEGSVATKGCCGSWETTLHWLAAAAQWRGWNVDVIDDAVDEWEHRTLRVCEKTKRHHFERLLN